MTYAYLPLWLSTYHFKHYIIYVLYGKNIMKNHRLYNRVLLVPPFVSKLQKTWYLNFQNKYHSSNTRKNIKTIIHSESTTYYHEKKNILYSNSWCISKNKISLFPSSPVFWVFDFPWTEVDWDDLVLGILFKGSFPFLSSGDIYRGEDLNSVIGRL